LLAVLHCLWIKKIIFSKDLNSIKSEELKNLIDNSYRKMIDDSESFKNILTNNCLEISSLLFKTDQYRVSLDSNEN